MCVLLSYRLALHLHCRQGPLPAGMKAFPSANTFWSYSQSVGTWTTSGHMPRFKYHQIQIYWQKCNQRANCADIYHGKKDNTLPFVSLDGCSVGRDTRSPHARTTPHLPDVDHEKMLSDAAVVKIFGLKRFIYAVESSLLSPMKG